MSHQRWFMRVSHVLMMTLAWATPPRYLLILQDQGKRNSTEEDTRFQNTACYKGKLWRFVVMLMKYVPPRIGEW